MRLLYLDDSGSSANASDSHLILAGLSVPQKKPWWISKNLDKIANRCWPDNPQGLEFRGSDIFSGRRHWRGIRRDIRHDAYSEALRTIADDRSVRVFAAVVDKDASQNSDPMELAFEHVCNRFDRYLLRLHRRGETERGLIILDKSSYETSLQGLAADFRVSGHSWGTLRNIAEVPLFVDSRATRLIQLADLIAYAFRRDYEYGDGAYAQILHPRIDADRGVMHGLVHHTAQHGTCDCVACSQRGRRPR